MKVIISTEGLNQGGAERQAVELALLLHRNNIDVKVLIYTNGNFYREKLEKNNIEIIQLEWKAKFKLLLSLNSSIKRIRPDVVWCFLPSTANYMEVLHIINNKWKLIVSERSAIDKITLTSKIKKFLHLFSDCIVTNSHANRMQLCKILWFIKNKIITVYNIIELPEQNLNIKDYKEPLKIIVLGRYNKVKNLFNLVLACNKLLENNELKNKFVINWYGQIQDIEYYNEAIKMINGNNLDNYIVLNKETKDPKSIYVNADLLIMASFYEGLPNSVCEAISFGLPVLASNVSDISNLVQDGKNGYIFDPENIQSIANSLKKFIELSPEEKIKFGKISYKIAKELFNKKIIEKKYFEILNLKKVYKIKSYPEKEPVSALEFINSDLNRKIKNEIA